MKHPRIIALIATTLTLAGCMNTINTIEATTTPIRSNAVFAEAKRLAADKMRDPEAARFKSEYTAYRSSAGDTIVCGTMNGKNAMGGYVGYKPFWIRVRNGNVMSFRVPSEGDDSGFEAQAITKNCADASAGTIMVSS